MDLVADTSILMAVVLNETERRAIVSATRGFDLIGPPVIPWEMGNALSAIFKRKRLTIADAKQALRAFERIPIRFVRVDILEALRLADRLSIYAYDAYFLECARATMAPLVSLDRDLIQNASDLGLEVLEI